MSEMPRETTEYDDTMEALRQAENALPDFTSSYDGEIRRLFERIVNRPAFRYDPGSDPLYQSARTQLMEAGSRAMRRRRRPSIPTGAISRTPRNAEPSTP